MKISKKRRALCANLFVCIMLIPSQTVAAQSWGEWFWSNKKIAAITAGALAATTLIVKYLWLQKQEPPFDDPIKYLNHLKNTMKLDADKALARYDAAIAAKHSADKEKHYLFYYNLFLDVYFPDLKEEYTQNKNLSNEKIREVLKKIRLALKNKNIHDDKTTQIVNALINHPMLARYNNQYVSLSLDIAQAHDQNSQHISTMEDTLIIDTNRTKEDAFFAIFDGYGGPSTAQYLADPGKGLNVEFFKHAIDPADTDSVKRFFADYDKKIDQYSGATAVIFILANDQGYFINLGACQGYVIRDEKVFKETTPHRCTDEDEKKRIQDAGSAIVNNLIEDWHTESRAFGDMGFKAVGVASYKDPTKPYTAPVVSNEPNVLPLGTIQAGDTILLMSSGVSKYVSPDDILEILKTRTNSKALAESLIDKAIAKKSKDNLSAIVIHVKDTPAHA